MLRKNGADIGTKFMRRWWLTGAPLSFLAGTALAQTGGAVRKLKVDAYSRHLQWLRTADEVAEAAQEMGYQGVDITVRPYPGHVDP